MSELGRRLARELAAAGVTSQQLAPLVERRGASWLAAAANQNADIEAQIEALLANDFGPDYLREAVDFYCRA